MTKSVLDIHKNLRCLFQPAALSRGFCPPQWATLMFFLYSPSHQTIHISLQSFFHMWMHKQVLTPKVECALKCLFMTLTSTKSIKYNEAALESERAPTL